MTRQHRITIEPNPKRVRVVFNGRVVADTRLQPTVATLAKWAARDNDRTMLFGAELHVEVK